MLERFTRESRRVVERAQLVARRLGAEQVEPEHLLVALAGGCEGPAALALAEAGLDAGTIENAIEEDLVAMLEVVGVPPSVLASAPPQPRADGPGFSPQVKRALENALREALRRRDRRLGTEHLLLGLLREPAATLRRILSRLDVEPERLAALVQVEAAARPQG
ncbi:MAG TPA: Clp protease N-terminal domain-containing protein [Solirubrobacteraceae bacterium]|nr:Clp protease N-terminal domain-containing protein [Solirubrobacteraceae bacterium]